MFVPEYWDSRSLGSVGANPPNFWLHIPECRNIFLRVFRPQHLQRVSPIASTQILYFVCVCVCVCVCEWVSEWVKSISYETFHCEIFDFRFRPLPTLRTDFVKLSSPRVNIVLSHSGRWALIPVPSHFNWFAESQLHYEKLRSVKQMYSAICVHLELKYLWVFRQLHLFSALI
jgi:hypothetical protein